MVGLSGPASISLPGTNILDGVRRVASSEDAIVEGRRAVNGTAVARDLYDEVMGDGSGIGGRGPNVPASLAV